MPFKKKITFPLFRASICGPSRRVFLLASGGERERERRRSKMRREKEEREE